MTGDGRLKIKNALVSVSDKSGLEELVSYLDKNKVSIFSTGGTAKFIKSLGINRSTLRKKLKQYKLI